MTKKQKLILMILLVALVWVWNAYGNFIEFVREYSYEILPIILVITSGYTLIMLRNYKWYFRGIPAVLILFMGSQLIGWIQLSKRHLIIIPIFSTFFLLYFIEWVRNRGNSAE
jgi:hypothetical protein